MRRKNASVPVMHGPQTGAAYLWQAAYLDTTPRETNIVTFTHGTFDYVYDGITPRWRPPASFRPMTSPRPGWSVVVRKYFIHTVGPSR